MHTKVFHISHGCINELDRTSPARVLVGENINCSLKVLLVLLLLAPVKITSSDHSRLIFVLIFTWALDSANHSRCVQLTCCKVFLRATKPQSATRP